MKTRLEGIFSRSVIFMVLKRFNPDSLNILFLLFFVGVISLPLLLGWRNLPATDDPDAFHLLSQVYVIFDAVRNYGEIPLWNPYFGGGIPWAGSVYNTGLSLVSLFYIAFGELFGTKLWILFILFLGSYGMYATSREWFGLKPSSALVGALFFVASSWLPGILISGDYEMLGYYSLPFAALCMLRLLQKRWLGLLLPFCYATAIAEGAKVWPLVIAGIVLVVALVYRAQCGCIAWQVICLWIISFGVGLLLSAPKLIPFWDLMQMDLVDQVVSREWITYDDFFEVVEYIINPSGGSNLRVGVGIAGSFFAVSGILLDWKRSLGLLGILTVAVIFGLGEDSPLPVIPIMTVIPLLNKVGSYGMYASLVILFCICGLAAIGFERLRWLISIAQTVSNGLVGSYTDILIILLAGITIIHTASFVMSRYSSLFTLPDFTATKESFYQVSHQSLLGIVDRYRETPYDHILANQYYNIRRGVGTITWLGNMVFPEYAQPKVIVDNAGQPIIQEGYLGEVYCIDRFEKGCEAFDLKLTYNTIRFHAKTARPSTIVLNFNYHPGWQVSSGKVVNHEGLLAVQLPTGSNDEVMLRFSDLRFTVGAGIALTTLVFWILGGSFWIRRNRKAHA